MSIVVLIISVAGLIALSFAIEFACARRHEERPERGCVSSASARLGARDSVAEQPGGLNG